MSNGIPMNYSQLGDYLAKQNPYSGEIRFRADLDDPASGVIIRPNLSLYWDFREPQSQQRGEPGRPGKLIKVANYPIVKAIVVPFDYTRLIPSDQHEPTPIPMKANLLIGYGPPLPQPDSPTLLPRVARTEPTDDQAPYPRLARFIRAQNPFSAETYLEMLPPTPDEPDRPEKTGLVTAVTWLADRSVARRNLASSSDFEMDLCQEQQCLYWDFPQPLPERTVGPSGENFWMCNYQVTKAFRFRYFYNEQTENGEIVKVGHKYISVTGSGDT
jgi:hypothetical protein